MNSALGLLFGMVGGKHWAPQPSLGPVAASANWGLSLPLGPEAAPVRRAKAKAAKPQRMFGKQSADAARGRKQTEAACWERFACPIWELDEQGLRKGGE